jgi:EKC/KEOPS complex subunit PCC1/LAGE3
VDKELSSLVRRTFSQTTPGAGADGENGQEEATLLRAEYRAATNRMLRVAVNSFMDSLALVIEVMEQLDVDVLAQAKAL